MLTKRDTLATLTFLVTKHQQVAHSVTVSTLRPDIVIIDEPKKNIMVLELTVPGELRIEEANRLKGEKYQHFTTDIKTHTVSVLPFEIG